MIELPNKLEEGVIKGINLDYKSSLNSRQPAALNAIYNRMKGSFETLSDNAKSFLDEKVKSYIDNFTYINKKQPLDFIYPKQNPEAEALALAPKIK